MKLTYKTKKPISWTEEKNLRKDINKANEKSRKMWNEVKKKMNSRIIKYTIGWTDTAKKIALNAEYFSETSIIEKVEIDGNKIHLHIDDAFITLLEYNDIIGTGALKNSINWIKERFGIETLNEEMLSFEKFKKETLRAFRDNGIEAELVE